MKVMIELILIFSAFAGIFFGILGFLIHKWWFKPQNNPDKALVFITGIDKPCKAHKIYSSVGGIAYAYWFQGQERVVIVPESYKCEYHYYRRVIYLDSLYHLIAVPTAKDMPLSNKSKNELIGEIISSKVGADAIHEIRSKSHQGAIIIIAVIVAIAAGAIGYALHRVPPPKVINQPQVTVNQTSPVTIISQGETK